MTLCATCAHPIKEKVIAEYGADGNTEHAQKINRTNAFANTMDMLVPTFVHKKCKEALRAFVLLVGSAREIIRSGRSAPPEQKTEKAVLDELLTIMNIY